MVLLSQFLEMRHSMVTRCQPFTKILNIHTRTYPYLTLATPPSDFAQKSTLRSQRLCGEEGEGGGGVRSRRCFGKIFARNPQMLLLLLGEQNIARAQPRGAIHYAGPHSPRLCLLFAKHPLLIWRKFTLEIRMRVDRGVGVGWARGCVASGVSFPLSLPSLLPLNLPIYPECGPDVRRIKFMIMNRR